MCINVCLGQGWMFVQWKVRVCFAGWRWGHVTAADRSSVHPIRPGSARARHTPSAWGRRSHRHTWAPAARGRRAENDLKHARTQTHHVQQVSRFKSIAFGQWWLCPGQRGEMWRHLDFNKSNEGCGRLIYFPFSSFQRTTWHPARFHCHSNTNDPLWRQLHVFNQQPDRYLTEREGLCHAFLQM